MILAFALVVISLVVTGAYPGRLRRATLYWGRLIAGLGHVQRDIDEAKASDRVMAAELLGRSVHQRGFQDAITPPWLTNFALLYWALCLATYIWGFFVLPWYVAAAWPVAFVVGKRIFASMLPRPDSDFYRQKLIAGLETRCNQFRRVGDDMRLAAAEYMVGLLRGTDLQTSGINVEALTSRHVLSKFLKSLGFRREEGLEGYLERYIRLTPHQREAVLDSAGSENLSAFPPEDQLAQTALNLWRNGKHQDALDYYNRAIALAPTNSTLLLNRGNLNFELGNISAAVSDFERAMSGSPKLPEHVFVNYQLIQTLGEDSPILQATIERRRRKCEQA